MFLFLLLHKQFLCVLYYSLQFHSDLHDIAAHFPQNLCVRLARIPRQQTIKSSMKTPPNISSLTITQNFLIRDVQSENYAYSEVFSGYGSLLYLSDS